MDRWVGWRLAVEGCQSVKDSRIEYNPGNPQCRARLVRFGAGRNHVSCPLTASQ